jgi:hypothetical protein
MVLAPEQREALNELPCRYSRGRWYDLGLWRLGLVQIVWGEGEDWDHILRYDLTDAGRAALAAP